MTEAACVRPPDFDLAAFWEQSVAELRASVPRYPATVRVTSDLVPQVKRSHVCRVEREEGPDGRGRVTLSLMFEVEGEACDFILRLGAGAEVLEPPALRARVSEFAEGIAAVYRRA